MAPLHVCVFANGNSPPIRCFQSSGLPLVTYFVVFFHQYYAIDITEFTYSKVDEDESPSV